MIGIKCLSYFNPLIEALQHAQLPNFKIKVAIFLKKSIGEQKTNIKPFNFILLWSSGWRLAHKANTINSFTFILLESR